MSIRNFSFSCVLIFISALLMNSSALFGQNKPDYPEREVLSTASGSAESNSQQFIYATDGALNPDEYYLGPGDKLIVSIRGVVDENYQLMINHEGDLFIPKVGIVGLRNKTLSQGKNIIFDAINEYYHDVNLDISLGEIRNIKVSVIGNVSKSQTYSFPANTRLIELIANSNIREDSDLRNISVIRSESNEKKYDLLSFLRLGDKLNNPYLIEGDVVRVDKIDKIVSIYGAVQYSGNYEFVENETLDHLIKIAGGLLDKAVPDSIELARFEGDNKTLRSEYYSFDEINSSAIHLMRGDKIIVREKPEYLMNMMVYVEGFVKHPGMHKIEKGKTRLREFLLNDAGGFLEDASLKDAYVIRTVGVDEIDPEFERLKTIPRADMTDEEYEYFKAISRERKGKMVVDFEQVFEMDQDEDNIILRMGDQIYIPEAVNYVSVVGQVVRPGNVIFDVKYSVDDYLDLTGGFAWRAEEGDVRVIKANTGEWIDQDDVENLEPGDIIWVPEKLPPPRFWDVFTDVLTVVSQTAAIIAALAAIIVATK